MFSDDNAHAAYRRQTGDKFAPAKKTLVIYFTARSASSWLSSILEATGRLGKGIELFNPEFMPDIARHFGARNLDEYIHYAKRFTNLGGVFSFEATPGHIIKTFGRGEGFLGAFPSSYNVLLLRNNIVAQGISLAKMVKVNVSHATALNDNQVRDADKEFSYDAALFTQWIKHLLHHELWLDNHLSSQEIVPLTLTYEQITAEGANKTLDKILNHVGVDSLPDGWNVESPHRKIGSKRNEEHEVRFREQETAFVKEVASQRQRILRRVEQA